MAFLEFKRFQKQGERLLRPTGKSFILAGHKNGLIYKAWKQQGMPLDTGWQVSRDELLRIHSKGEYDSSTHRLVIDFDPNADWRIGLIELLDVYAFTWSNGNGAPDWTPLMLRLTDVFYGEYDPPLDSSQKNEILNGLPEPEPDAPDFVEFLYLQGPDRGWNWGMNGMANAAFLHDDAREYFRQFF